jgi:hypothetical protein
MNIEIVDLQGAVLHTPSTLTEALTLWRQCPVQDRWQRRVVITEPSSLMRAAVDTRQEPWSTHSKHPVLTSYHRQNFAQLMNGVNENLALIPGTFADTDAAIICLMHIPQDAPQDSVQAFPIALLIDDNHVFQVQALNPEGDPNKPGAQPKEPLDVTPAARPGAPVLRGTVSDIRDAMNKEPS